MRPYIRRKFKMHILLTNDDGILSPGLGLLYHKLTGLGKVTVVAPSQPKSGAGHSISLGPMTCEKLDITGKFVGYSVNGTPADCVKLAVNELFDDEPIDLVVSGINYGANVGIHVHYSGTVAAAIESAFYGIPAIALSAAYEDEIDMISATDHGYKIIEKLLPLSAQSVININIPQLSKGKPKGVRVASHAVAGYMEQYETTKNELGQIAYQFTGGCHSSDQPGPAIDTDLLTEGYITVTALHFDMTDYEKNGELEKIDLT